VINIKLYEKAIEHFGKTAQLKKWIEELDELKVEIQRFIDGEGDIDHLISEIADVHNLTVQFAMIYDIDGEEINKNMELKMLRTSQRIDSGYYNS
jgi:NTP pyrophosphatase (non-canonical NTP hydrolase)